ncbi:extracellular solute-binding protein [Bacillaceae bacterium SIJ1]|nr:extracellular solute-binding protein [Litoribacterium kuwaitense]
MNIWMTSIVVVMLTLTVACSGNEAEKATSTEGENASVEVNKEGFPIVDETIQLSMMGPNIGAAEWEDMEVLQTYEEMTNMDFEYDTPPLSDFQTKLNLAFAGKDVSDVIYGGGLTPNMEVDYGSQGILIPLEGLIDEYAPHFKQMMEEDPSIRKAITTIDGHIYSLPQIFRDPNSPWPIGPLWYNGDWLDALGVTELPKTTDEFYELLKRFKTEDPNGNGQADEIPLTDVKERHARIWLLGAFGLKEWGIEEVDGTVRYTPMTENYKEYLAFMNKLYEEELLDQDAFSQTDEQKIAKGQDNRIGVFQSWYSYFATGQTEDEAVNNPMFHPLTSPASEDIVIARGAGINRGAFSITSNNPYPEATMRWIDYLYSQDGYEFFAQGPAGYLWEWEDEEAGTKKWLDAPEGFKTTEDYRGTLTPNYGISAPGLVDVVRGKEVTNFDEFVRGETKEKIEPYAEVAFPLVYLTKEEQKDINTIEVDLESYVEQMEAKFITGVEPLSNWEQYVETIERMNIEKYVQIHQDAYDRWSAS